ncbi:hypothetical protein QRD43_21230 [Pelomonas sp. APW6]|uniref:Uncharacterized protein n=1 Tax=Roseateles subflavus TaxID=3053353 RepID=A0ABT7LRU5_9BURK|nr:hypothetical protein [Pelomonas sp. APW6]MDL5034440.1 hypothetical protein [Pelomonas sp. APW6]
MNKIAASAIVASAIFAITAHAQGDVVVIKDTRQYAPFNSSVSGPVGCTMPKDLDHPNLEDENECRVTRGKLTTSGELVTRSNSRGVCVRTVFSGGTRRMGGDPAREVIPDQSMSEETFKCDSVGARVS